MLFLSQFFLACYAIVIWLNLRFCLFLAAKASVYQKDQLYDSLMFKVLLGSLGCATLVFTVLITFLCLEMRKKRLERRPRQFYNVNSGVLQWPPRPRSDSKSYGRQHSNSSTAPLTIHDRHGYWFTCLLFEQLYNIYNSSF